MKLSCGIIMDLLPLYEEGICSEETKKAVEDHLKECHTCRSYLDDVHKFSDEESSLKAENAVEADKVVAKSFRKIKKRWIYSIILAIFLIPVCCLGWNEIHKTGVHFTNIREIYIGHQFVKELQLGNYDKAFKYLNLKDKKLEYRNLGEKKLENFEEKAYESFLESAELLEEAGGVKGYQYKGIIASEHSEGYDYDVTFVLEVDGKRQRTTFEVTDNGVNWFSNSGSFRDDPIAHLGAWSEWLWQDLNGCHFDFEAGEYVWD